MKNYPVCIALFSFRDEVTYRIDRGGTKRGNDKLVDSLGFSYTLKVWLTQLFQTNGIFHTAFNANEIFHTAFQTHEVFHTAVQTN